MAHSIKITPFDYIKLVDRYGFLTVVSRSNTTHTRKYVSYWSYNLMEMMVSSRIGYFKDFLAGSGVFELILQPNGINSLKMVPLSHKVISIANSDYIMVQW